MEEYGLKVHYVHLIYNDDLIKELLDDTCYTSER